MSSYHFKLLTLEEVSEKHAAKHNYFYMNINEANFGSAFRNDKVPLLIRMHKDGGRRRDHLQGSKFLLLFKA